MSTSSKLIRTAVVFAGAALLAACGSQSPAKAALGGSTTCKAFMSATEADQNQAVNKVATELRAPDAVTPAGRPEVNYLCAANPDMKLSAAVASAGGKGTGSGSSTGSSNGASLDREGLLKAAKEAIQKTTSYDYRTLNADEAAAKELMTPAFARTYTESFDGIRTQAAKASVTVTDTTLASAVLGIAEDSGCVLSFDDQESTKNGENPTTFQNTIVATLTRADGKWLLESLHSGVDGTCPRMSDPDSSRTAAKDAAIVFANAMSTFSPETMSAYPSNVEALLTDQQAAKFREQYGKANLGSSKTTSKVDQIIGAASSSDGDIVTALVAFDTTVSQPTGTTQRHYRWSVDLKKVDGKWLVDDFTPIS